MGVENEFILGLYPRKQAEGDFIGNHCGKNLNEEIKFSDLKSATKVKEEFISISTKQTKIKMPETMKFRCGDEDSENLPQKKRKPVKKEYSDDESYEEDEDEEEDGQILIPKGIIMDDINDLKAD